MGRKVPRKGSDGSGGWCREEQHCRWVQVFEGGGGSGLEPEGEGMRRVSGARLRRGQ